MRKVDLHLLPLLVLMYLLNFLDRKCVFQSRASYQRADANQMPQQPLASPSRHPRTRSRNVGHGL
jgi:hypothetical protein